MPGIKSGKEEEGHSGEVDIRNEFFCFHNGRPLTWDRFVSHVHTSTPNGRSKTLAVT